MLAQHHSLQLRGKTVSAAEEAGDHPQEKRSLSRPGAKSIRRKENNQATFPLTRMRASCYLTIWLVKWINVSETCKTTAAVNVAAASRAPRLSLPQAGDKLIGLAFGRTGHRTCAFSRPRIPGAAQRARECRRRASAQRFLLQRGCADAGGRKPTPPGDFQSGSMSAADNNP